MLEENEVWKWIVRRNYVCKMQRHYRKKGRQVSFLAWWEHLWVSLTHSIAIWRRKPGVNMSEISSFHFLILLVNVAAKITISNDPISYTNQHGIHEYFSLHVRWNYNSFLFNFHNSICVLSLPRHADVV